MMSNKGSEGKYTFEGKEETKLGGRWRQAEDSSV